MNKSKIYIILITCISLFFISNVYAASLTLSGSSSGTPGKKITVTVKGDFTGRVNLTVSNGTLSKSNLWIENNSQSVTVTLGSSGSTIVTATPAAGASDSSGNIITVAAKSKTIGIKEATTNTQTVTQKSSNCNLSKITLNVEGLSFKSSQTTYNINVGSNVNNITVKATPAHSKATYSVSGNTDLKSGHNVIKIVVKAENGKKKTYTINVEKAGDIEETSSALTNLIVEDMVFEETFEKTVTEYNGGTIPYTDKINVLAYTEAENATYDVIGADLLKIGQNEVVIRVVSNDESSTTDYVVKFEMLAKEEENALQTVGPNVIDTPNVTDEITLLDKLKANGLTIIVYLLAVVEFIQVIYLYLKLEKTKEQLEQNRTRNGAK